MGKSKKDTYILRMTFSDSKYEAWEKELEKLLDKLHSLGIKYVLSAENVFCPRPEKRH